MWLTTFFPIAVCVPLLCGCGCSARVFGACVLPCLEWSNCCFEIPDPICVLYNVGCAIVRAAVEIAIFIAEAALIIAEGVLVVIEGVVRGLQFVVDQARFVLDAVIAILEVVKVTLVVGLAALEAVTKFLLTGIINIKEIGFDVRLELFSHGRLSAYIVVGFFGQPPDRYSVTIPIFNPFALVGDLAKRAIPGLEKKKRSMGGRNKVLM